MLLAEGHMAYYGKADQVGGLGGGWTLVGVGDWFDWDTGWCVSRGNCRGMGPSK